MGKKRKHLSHEEIWDDSALVNSWDAALQEYQLYHSIHARGERVEDILKEAEASEEAPTKEEELTGHPSLNTGNGLLDSEDLEDGEVKDDQVDNDPTSIAGVKDEPIQIDEQISAEQAHDVPAAAQFSTNNNDAPAHQGIPDLLTNGVQDEGLRNLMMSWYYAGYYTGLYEGRKQSGSATTNGLGSGGAAI